MPGLHLVRGVADNEFVIGGGVPDGRISWKVVGTRNDPYIVKHPIITEVPQDETTIVKRGQCIFAPNCQ